MIISGYTLTNQTRFRFRVDASNNGDDVYLIPHNLKHVLKRQQQMQQEQEEHIRNQSLSSESFLYFGNAMLDHNFHAYTYCDGGAGYVLNRGSLERFWRSRS